MAFREALDCEEQASLLQEVPAQGQSRLGKSVVLALASISACAFVAGWARSGAASQIAVDGLMSKSEAECTQDGEDCSTSKCCKNTGSTCFKKNDHWSSCNATCAHNHKWMGRSWGVVDEKVWDCEVVGKPTSKCTQNGEDCSTSKCCAEWGAACFKKNEHWASCNATCNPYNKWENNAWHRKSEKIWDCTVLSTAPCKHDGEDCSSSQCCLNPESTCYRKNEHWASCNRTCTKNWKWVDNRWQEQGKDDNIWACDVLGGDDDVIIDGEDENCTAEAEEKCVGCQGTSCLDCRYDARIACCQRDSDRNLTTCCEVEGVPSHHTKCGGDGKVDETCKMQAEAACIGCQGTQCLSCQHDKQIGCCVDKACTEECKKIETCYPCKHDAEKRKACCAEEGVPTHMPVCNKTE